MLTTVRPSRQPRLSSMRRSPPRLVRSRQSPRHRRRQARPRLRMIVAQLAQVLSAVNQSGSSPPDGGSVRQAPPRIGRPHAGESVVPRGEAAVPRRPTTPPWSAVGAGRSIGNKRRHASSQASRAELLDRTVKRTIALDRRRHRHPTLRTSCIGDEMVKSRGFPVYIHLNGTRSRCGQQRNAAAERSIDPRRAADGPWVHPGVR